jgi:hypothetical protein
MSSYVTINSEYILKNYNRLLNEVRKPDVYKALEAVRDKETKGENTIFNITPTCSIPMLSNLRDHMVGLKGDVLKDYLIKQPQNPDVLKATMCLVDSLFYSSPYDVGSLYLNNRIKLYIHNLNQIGPDSIEGYAMTADFENVKDMFIVKSAKDPKNDNLQHELIVGLYGTNKLRQYIPNFAYIYGGFKCSPPLIDPETKKVVTWCLNNENAVNYVLYENITPAITLAKYIETCSGKEFLNAYMQVLYALRTANKIIDYTHYDLHYENIYMRVPKTQNAETISFEVPYETERGVEYIITKNVPTITDYSYSHIKYKQEGEEEQHFGRSKLIPFSIYPYRSWIMHDLYKLLMFCLMGAIKYNNSSVITEATKIFRFFNNSEDPIVAVEKQWTVRFAFPLTDLTNKMSINDLAKHIRTLCDCDFIKDKKTGLPVLNCEKVCISENEIYSKIGVNPKDPLGIPDNILEFYDIAVRLQNQGRDAEKNRIGKEFKYKDAMKNHIEKMETQINELENLRRKIKLFDLSKMSFQEVLNYDTMMLVRSMYISIGSMIDKNSELLFYKEIGVAVARTYEDEQAIKIMENMVAEFNKKIKPSLDEAKRVFNSNHDVINRSKNNEIVQKSIKKDERLRWYWEGRELFDLVFSKAV